MSTAVHRLHVDLDDQAADRYPEIAFEPAGSDSVAVTLAYDTTGAVIDLGCVGPDGWRGWSGGARDRFVIGPTEATPGYVPGELEPGRWAVVLGLHVLPAAGVDVEVTVTTPADIAVTPDEGAPSVAGTERRSAQALPAPDGLRWFACDFHSHSTHSDGDESLDQLTARAATHGLGVLAITDHNTVSHHPHLAGVGARHDLTLIPGQEITTARGHANAFGEIGWIDFRGPADTWVTEVERRGGLLSVNHPIEGDCSWDHPLTQRPEALELWHIGWFRDLTSTAMWSWWRQWRQDAAVVGGSDFHHDRHHYEPGTPTTWVAAEDRSVDAILAGVRARRTAMSWGPRNCPMLLRVDDDLVALAADGTVLVDLDGRRRVLHGNIHRIPAAKAGTPPFRLEAADRTLLAIAP